ncbi:MAG TPA: helix-turn-helix domain-containing protein, partial [Rhodoglobus sp.]|nr:helix-turn-helix domain-containing protein [Rhodoglobus sp.]
MMNQENYVNVNDLHKQGWTISEIAAETGWHRTTVSKYLKDGPPAARATEAPVMTEEWRSRIDTMLGAYPRLLSVSVHNKLRAEGFEGSYPTVVRAVRDLRGPRFRAANLVSVPIHTAPGDEAQFDFCDVSGWAARFGWRGPLFVFG